MGRSGERAGSGVGSGGVRGRGRITTNGWSLLKIEFSMAGIIEICVAWIITIYHSPVCIIEQRRRCDCLFERRPVGCTQMHAHQRAPFRIPFLCCPCRPAPRPVHHMWSFWGTGRTCLGPKRQHSSGESCKTKDTAELPQLYRSESRLVVQTTSSEWIICAPADSFLYTVHRADGSAIYQWLLHRPG